jgi:hypothetical protein
MDNPAFTEASFSDARVIMVIMCMPVEELLCQAVIGQNAVLKYLLVSCMCTPVAMSWHARH